MKIQKSYLNYPAAERIILLLLFFGFFVHDIAGQNSGQKVTRQTATNAFSQKKFDEAYSQFTELSASYPADPLYKYYCGACLVETGKEPGKASRLLREAASGSGSIRSVPPDCFFYLGRALQMSGEYPEAIEAYNRFGSQAGKKATRELNVSEYIKQCNDGKGKIASAGTLNPGVSAKDTASKKSSVSAVTSISPVAVVNNAPHTDTLPAEYNSLLGETLESKIKADSIAQVTNHKAAVTQHVDSSAIKMREASGKMNYITGTGKDTLSVSQKEGSSASPVFSDFLVKQKPVYKQGEKVSVDPGVPAGLIYRIQVGMFRNPVAPSYFKGIEPVQGFRNPASGITTYYAGRFRKSADAGKSLLKVKTLGFRDAFVVALMDKKIVSADRASVLEKEWGSKPLFSLASKDNGASRDTVPPTLVFRVEVKRTQKPLPADQVEALRKMSASRGFDIVNSEPKQYIYLIGRFFTFKSATEFADLLVRNGYRDAKVVAWLGKREIPVETAKQLFEEQ